MRVGGQLHAPAALTPGKRPVTHFIGGWVGPDERIILKRIFKKWDGGAWIGLIWLRIGTGGGLL
jgi:hypothetical protein